MLKRVYVISDLHIGGDYADGAESGSRGFRICTHVDTLVTFVRSLIRSANPQGTELVINGDLVDFLAEKRDVRDPASGEVRVGWQPLIDNPSQAAAILRRIIDRDKAFFVALKDMLAAGSRLTITLGNHDVELSFPALRRVLEDELDAGGKRFSFIYDGEAYQVGKVLIEHGNRYDEWNVVTHDSLRRIRSVQSRLEPALDVYRNFEAPPGSFLVAGVMNEIKTRYPFIDLLKPESEAAIPILLALAPEYRQRILTIAGLVARSRKHAVGLDGLPSDRGDIGNNETRIQETPGEALVNQILQHKLPSGKYQEFIAATNEALTSNADHGAAARGDIQDGTVRSLWSMVKLLVARPSDPVSSRLTTLLAALEGTRDDFSFDRQQEKEPYRSAAQRLLAGGFDVVLFGHTHLAKEIKMAEGTYINTGTWADVLPFPSTILDPDERSTQQPVRDIAAVRLKRLDDFVADMATARLGRYLRFIPTYARIELGEEGEVKKAELREYRGEAELA